MSRQIVDAARRATCPVCGKTGDRAVVMSASRVFIDLACPCGATWRADRFTGRLIARMSVED